MGLCQAAHHELESQDGIGAGGWQLMLTIGLTGGIGAGKSTVSRRLADLGATVIDADLIAREVVAVGTPGLRQVRERFGDEVIGADGALDRPRLGAIVFDDDEARADLNAIVHPLIFAETRRRFAAAAPDAIVVHDMPLLVELNQQSDYHLTVVVGVREQVRLERLVRDRGMSEQEARARMAAQADDDQRRAAADVWLENESTPEQVLTRVDALWRQRLRPYEENLRSVTPARTGDVLGEDLRTPVDADRGRRIVARVETQLSRRLAGPVTVGLADGDVGTGGGADRDHDHGHRLTVSVPGSVPLDDRELVEGLSAAGLVPAPTQPGVFLGADPGVRTRAELDN